MPDPARSSRHALQGQAALRSRLLASLDFLVPILLLALGTLLIRIWDLDLRLSSYFYSAAGNWRGKGVLALDWLYDFGTLPALLTALLGLGVVIAGLFRQRLRVWRKNGLYLALVMLLGPGLVVNAVLKEYWGRPRPRNVVEFRGRYAFEPVLTIDPGSPGESFPSGHASMGFYFFALHFVLRRRHRLGSLLFLLLGLVYGSGMGVVRLAQGGHFASDVLWSGALVWLICAGLYYLLRLHRKEES